MFLSYSLEDFEKIFIDDRVYVKDGERILALIDIANGHMDKLYQIAKRAKITYGYSMCLMVGNVANPKTYEMFAKLGVDYIRVGIGGGSGCLTSANTGVHYPMASLISECYQIKKSNNFETRIIADGGFRNYDDIIKALALGADYVMLGGVFNKSLESCGETFLKDTQEQYYEVDMDRARVSFEAGISVYKYYRGMSTKEVQKSWNRHELKTGEGITKYNKVEYTLPGWCENFTDYLKSAMSYTNSRNLQEFIGEVRYEMITQNSFNRFNK